MIWMISANGRMYDHASSFAKNGFIDWRQRAKYSIGDIVYIYCTRPIKRVMYKCEVVEHSKPFSQCIDDVEFWVDINEYEKAKDGLYARLKLVEQVDTVRLSLEYLLNNGLTAAPQGPIKISNELHSYIDGNFNDYYAEGLFVDVDEQKHFHEGHARSVKVNIFERSSVARGKCIEYHGLNCLICGTNFGEKYGALGEGFIHVHHLRPLHTIGEDYVVDYKKDLIPVCPNCHAMIHRIPNVEKMSINEIKEFMRQSEQDGTEKEENSENCAADTVESQEQNPVAEVQLGAAVKHKLFGDGIISELNIDKNVISVIFSSGEKKFIFTDVFSKGIIQIKID